MTMTVVQKLLRGARIRKRGKHVISFNSAVGMVAQAGAAGVTVLAIFVGSANANQCGTLAGAGGTIICTPDDPATGTGGTYGTVNGAPSGAGAGTEASPGTTAIAYSGTRTVDTTVTLDDLFLRPATGTAVSMTTGASSAAIRSIISASGETNIQTLANGARGVSLVDQGAVSAGTAVTIDGNTTIAAAGNSLFGALVQQTGANATGMASLTLSGDSNIATSGTSAIGAAAFQGGANASGDVSIVVNGTANVSTTGQDSHALQLSQSGSAAVGDALVALSGDATVTTSGLRANGVTATQSGASATGKISVVMSGDASLTTQGAQAAALLITQSGISASGDAVAELNGNARASASGITSHAVHVLQTGTNATGDVVITLNDDSVANTTGESANAVLAQIQGAAASGNTQVTLNDRVTVTSSGRFASGVAALQSAPSATGTISVTLNDEASVSSSGDDAAAVRASQSGVNPIGDVIVTMNDNVSVETSGSNSQGVLAQILGAQAQGDVVVNLNAESSITTSGATGAVGLRLLQSGTFATGSMSATLNGDAKISTSGQSSAGISIAQTGASSEGKVELNLNGGSSVSTSGRASTGVAIDQTGTSAIGDLSVSMNDSASVSTAGLFASGVSVSQTGASATGSVTVTLSDSAMASTSGDYANTVNAQSLGSGDVGIELNDTVVISQSGVGGVAVNATVSRFSEPLLDENGFQVMRQVINGDGSPRFDAAGAPVLVGVTVPAANLGTNSATITVNGGSVSNTGNNSTGLQAVTNNVGGSAQIEVLGGSVTSSGENVTSITAQISGPTSVRIGSDGLAMFEVIRDRNGNIILNSDGTAAVRPVLETAPLRRVDGNGDPVLSTGVASIEIADATVMATGLNATGAAASNDGSGATDVTVADGGSVLADGDGSSALDLASSGTGDLTATVEAGGTVGATGDGSTAIGADITNADSDGVITIDVAGDVTADGVDAAGVATDSAGSGATDVTVADGGSVLADGDGSSALDLASSGTGDLTATVEAGGTVGAIGDGSTAIGADITNADSDGVITINVAGDVTADGVDAAGVATDSAGSGATDVTIADGGSVLADGDGSSALDLASSGTGDLTATVEAGGTVGAIGDGSTAIGADITNADSDGVITINVAGDVTADGMDAAGVATDSAGSGATDVTVADGGSVLADGDGSSALDLASSGTGDLTATVEAGGTVGATGDGSTAIGADITNADSDGVITINVAGDVTADGMDAAGVATDSAGSGATDVTVADGGSVLADGDGSSALDLASSGTGDLTATVEAGGTVGATGDGSTAIGADITNADSDGVITINVAGDVTADGMDAAGVATDSAGSGATDVTVADGGSVLADGDGSSALDLASSGTGDLTATVEAGGTVGATGDGSTAIGADITNADSDGVITINVAGDVTADGMDAAGVATDSAGSGATDVTVADGGSVLADGDGSSALDLASSGTGDLTATVEAGGTVGATGDGSTAIGADITNADSDGVITINVAGDVTADGMDAAGVATDSAGSGATDVTVADGGSVLADGDGSSALDLASSGTGDLTATVEAGGTVGAIGDGSTAIGADITNADSDGVITINVAGDVTADGVGSVAIGLENLGTGGSDVVISSSGSVTNGAEDSYAIQILGSDGNVDNAGFISGGIDITGTLTNRASGTTSLTGNQQVLVDGSVENSGNINVSGTTAAPAMQIGGDLTNNGTVTIGGNSVAVGGDVSGSGTLVTNVDFATGSSGTLVIGGDLVGTLLVTVVPVGGDATLAGISAVSIFDIGGTVTGNVALTNGPINFGIYVFDLAIVGGRIVSTVDLSPAGASHAALPDLMQQGFANLQSYGGRVKNRVYTASSSQQSQVNVSTKGNLNVPMALGSWVSIEAAQFTRTPVGGDQAELSRWTLQGGYDFEVDTSATGTLVIGMGIGVGTLDASIATKLGVATVASQGVSLLSTATYTSVGGTYVDLQVKAATVKTDLSGPTGSVLAKNVGSTVAVAALEVGHSIALSERSSITPHVRVTAGQVSTEGYVDSNGLTVSAQDTAIQRVSLGAEHQQVLATGTVISLFGEYTRDLNPTGNVIINGVLVETGMPEDWFKLGVRGASSIGENSTLSWQVEYDGAIDAGSSKNSGLSAGMGIDIRW